jgi:predicted ATPase/signal transduction histidine kinase/tRNA A-37 threonylcarbamoyl transferase component Bud32
MRTIDGFKLKEQLYHAYRTTIFRAIEEDSGRSVILKCLDLPDLGPQQVARFEREYTIQSMFSSDELTKAYALKRIHGQHVIVMEDIGGESLFQHLKTNERLSLRDGLFVALSVARGLGQLHQQNVIHKDINPSNIVWDAAHQKVQIIDFGLATRLKREQPLIRHYRVLEGTLRYLSPEQTGRMNRHVDYRTDFYSFGAMLYHLFAGHPPFIGDEAIELIHAHIALKPTPLHLLDVGIPEGVSRLVEKLMAKTAEGRYQSAFGLVEDLRHCMETLEESGDIPVFALGEKDRQGYFHIPETLYGRETEVDTLLQSFDEVCEGKSKLVLVSGQGGIGKSALVKEIHKPLLLARGAFLSGKTDQLQRDTPYRAFIEAFQMLIDTILMGEADDIAKWKTRWEEALGDHIGVLIEVLPDMAKVVGNAPVPVELPPAEARVRFQRLFQRLVRASATFDHPLCLFLDDLQWLDAGSFKLLEQCLLDAETKYLLCVGAYRADEIADTHPLHGLEAALEEVGIEVESISLAPLSQSDVKELLVDTIQCTRSQAQSLATCCYDKTDGNPFFLRQFLLSLVAEGHLRFDQEKGRWLWSLQEIEALESTDNVVSFMLEQLQKQSDDVQGVLKVAAAVGFQFSLSILMETLSLSGTKVASLLQEAIDAGVVLPVDETHSLALLREGIEVVYMFAHDRVQQAAYALLKEDEQGKIHLQIGRHLQAHHKENGQEERYLFDWIDHLNRASHLIEEEHERLQLARHNLNASLKARQSAAFEAAYVYSETGYGLLLERHWTTHRQLALDLAFEAAETAYFSTDFAIALERANDAIKQLDDTLEIVRFQRVILSVYQAQTRIEEVVSLGISILASLGVSIPPAPQIHHILLSLAKTRWLLFRHPPSSLLTMPQMSDPYKREAMEVLMQMATAAYNLAELFPVLMCKMAELSFRFGLTASSPYAFSAFALLLCGVLEQYNIGFELGDVAWQLQREGEYRQYDASLAVMVPAFSRHWKEPFVEQANSFKLAYEMGLESGDLAFAATGIYSYCQLQFFMNVRLHQLLQQMETTHKALKELKQGITIEFFEPFYQLALCLSDREEITKSLTGEILSQEVIDERLRSTNKTTTSLLSTSLATLAYLLDDLPSAMKHSERMMADLEGVIATYIVPYAHFLDGMIQVAALREGAGGKTGERRRKIRKCLRKLRRWAKLGPDNYQGLYYLLLAEWDAFNRRVYKALDHYDQAIHHGYERDAYLVSGVGALRCGVLLRSLGRERMAQQYLGEARRSFEGWEAHALVRHLTNTHFPRLPLGFGSQSSQHLTTTGSHHTSHHSTHEPSHLSSQASLLDMSSLMKSTQAISESVVLSELLERLLSIAMENAGAQVGVLCLQEGSTLYVEAIGSTADGNVEVLQHQPFKKSQHCPRSVLRLVVNTGEPLLLHDVSREPRFSRDEFIIQHRPLSVLCVPILHHGQFTGLIYLDNRLTSGAFSEEHIGILQLLSAQAAISIQNARLYAQLEDKVAERTKELRDAQAQLVQSEKMASLGTLVAGVAHELNNPTNFAQKGAENLQRRIQKLTDLFEGMVDEDDQGASDELEQLRSDYFQPITDNLNAVVDGTKRARDIVRDLLLFSRLDEAPNETHPLNKIVLGALAPVTSEFEQCVTFVTELHSTRQALLVCWPSQLHQVFTNMMVNACQAMGMRDEQRKEVEEARLVVRTAMCGHDRVDVSFEDNGVGMSEDARSRIFDPFFTTKPVGKGVGLGLYISYQILERHKAEIQVDSVPDQGTTFTLRFPLA